MEIARRSEADDFAGVLAQLITGGGNRHRFWISLAIGYQAELCF